MREIFDRQRQRVPIRCWATDADDGTMQQAVNLSNLPFVLSHVSLMPDAHVGFGMPIGGVIATEGAIVPNAVGVDIGCGMVAWNAHVPAEGVRPHFQDIIDEVHRQIPLGFAHRTPSQGHKLVQQWCPQFLEHFEGTKKSKAYLSGQDKIIEQLGTLGGGNHFVELQADPEGGLWVMLHSGSRNVGKQINDHFQKLARQACRQAGTVPADAGLCHLAVNGEQGQDYIEHMRFAMDFAYWNRFVMMKLVQQIVVKTRGGREANVATAGTGDALINIHHNYADQEEHMGRSVWVHRKGATSARAGQLGIIPGSMGTKSYLVRGKGSETSFMSCSHGAGRVMGRQDAKRRISMDRFKKTMEGVVFKVSPRNLDEAPDAYKDLDAVMLAQADLVETVTELRPLAVVKG